MHELSVAHAIVTTVVEALPSPSTRVSEVRVRIGALSGVVPEALQFAYEVAADGTALADTVLVIERVPVTVHCSSCERDTTLEGITGFACSQCGQPTGDIITGKELDVAQIVIDEPVAAGDRP
jgi:hydrogenase nickel incorporation protein HypA/HybF